jgi:hypothetical protein
MSTAICRVRSNEESLHKRRTEVTDTTGHRSYGRDRFISFERAFTTQIFLKDSERKEEA